MWDLNYFFILNILQVSFCWLQVTAHSLTDLSEPKIQSKIYDVRKEVFSSNNMRKNVSQEQTLNHEKWHHKQRYFTTIIRCTFKILKLPAVIKFLKTFFLPSPIATVLSSPAPDMTHPVVSKRSVDDGVLTSARCMSHPAGLIENPQPQSNQRKHNFSVLLNGYWSVLTCLKNCN